MKYGFDVSHHNGTLNFKDYPKDFVIIRAGYGSSVKQTDTKFVQNVTAAKDNKVPFGLYWYSYASTPTGAMEEATAFHTVINKYADRSTPIFIDIEDPSIEKIEPARKTAIVEAFLQVMRNLGWTNVGMYTSDSWYSTGVKAKQPCIYWLARWGGTPKNEYHIWQYTAKARDEKFDPGHDIDCSQCSDELFNKIFSQKWDYNFTDMDIDKDGQVTAHDALTILQNVVKGDDNG